MGTAASIIADRRQARASAGRESPGGDDGAPNQRVATIGELRAALLGLHHHGPSSPFAAVIELVEGGVFVMRTAAAIEAANVEAEAEAVAAEALAVEMRHAADLELQADKMAAVEAEAAAASQLATGKRKLATTAAGALAAEGTGPLLIEHSVRLFAGGPGVSISYEDLAPPPTTTEKEARTARRLAKKGDRPVLLDISAPGCEVTLIGIDIISPKHAESVQHWAGTVQLEGCDLTGCFSVNGMGAVASLMDCHVHDSELPGCRVGGGASMKTEGGSVQRCPRGIVVSGSGRHLDTADSKPSKLTLADTVVEDCTECGIQAVFGGEVLVKSGAEKIQNNGSFTLPPLAQGTRILDEERYSDPSCRHKYLQPVVSQW
jgi:hypothetical protein